MKKTILLFLSFAAFSGLAEPLLDKTTIHQITEEISEAAKNKDVTPMEKYMYEGTVIVVDMDPHPDKGLVEMPFDDNFVDLAKMTMQMTTDWNYQDEIVSIDIDKAKNQAIVKEKSSVSYTIMGQKVSETTSAVTVYGVVNGEIKILNTREQLISSKMAQ